MQVQQLPIYQFLEGSGKSFIIPVYQRDYAWTKINCQKLWSDLIELNNNSSDNHFLGTLVTIGVGSEEYTVIDGQQRLTTVSLLLKALHHFLEEKENKDKESINLMNQSLEFLVNKYEEGEKKIRLKPNKQDKKFFENLFENPDELGVNSNIINNYNFFLDKISSNSLTPREVFDSFRKLKIVWIILERGQDDPQLIFESLNSTGVDLTAGDLIRNYILMDLNQSKQEKLYKQYWIKIENLSGNVAEFVRNYLIFKERIWVKKADVYSIFKEYALSNFKKDKEAILNDLLVFAELFSWFTSIKEHKNIEINKRLKRLNKLEFTICYPYLFDIFNDIKLGNVDEKTVVKILIIIESHAFRKILVDNSTEGLNKMFITLSKEIKKEDTWKEQYINILNYILLKKSLSQRIPNNNEFENALINKEVYRLQAKNKNFLLESLENYNPAYPVNLENLTVEHVMPQTLTKDWKNKLGDNWQEIHNKYLHTLGNLSLTAKNSELSNNSFEDKQRIDSQTSKLKLNYKIVEQTTWDENTILSRAKNLVQDAKKIWPYPETTYSKPILEEQKFDLESEDNFTHKKLSRLFFESEEMEVETWSDLLKKVCKCLYEFSPTEFTKIEKSDEFKWLFNTSKEKYRKHEFIKNHFIKTSFSAKDIIKNSKRICERIGYPAYKISFSLKNTKK